MGDNTTARKPLFTFFFVINIAGSILLLCLTIWFVQMYHTSITTKESLDALTILQNHENSKSAYVRKEVIKNIKEDVKQDHETIENSIEINYIMLYSAIVSSMKAENFNSV